MGCRAEFCIRRCGVERDLEGGGRLVIFSVSSLFSFFSLGRFIFFGIACIHLG